jgi:uncharacterized repeat protein (TIGR01451 family)
MGRRVGEVVSKLLLAAGLGLLSGCFGVSQNPSYFPYLLPTGDIIQTHAKPPGPGYFANFDPHAVRLEVRPVETTNPVRTQQVFIATVYDECGQPRRDRRVEWMVEGTGNIVEVDESGLFPGRGYKVDNKYAVSYTSYCEHRITRGNVDPNDDFVIRPGQTWCVISSAVEGDTHVTVYAPEIANWEKHKVFVTCHWVDAGWVLPPPAVNRAGTEHVINTNVYRHTDRQPLANYRVRYRVLDGPPAIFLPNRTQETVVVSDLSGNASASLVQTTPQPGINRIGVEIIRPPDPTSPSGAGIIIGRGETTKEWQAAQVVLTLTGPPTATVGQDIPYTITLTNNGSVDTQGLTVRDRLPDGVQLVRADPRPVVEGNQLIWTLGLLPPGRSAALQVVLRASQPGPVTNCAAVTTLEGLSDTKCVTTQITAAPGLAPQPAPPATVQPPPPAIVQPPITPQPAGTALTLTMNDVPTAVVGVPFTYQIGIGNSGSTPATNVLLSASPDKGLEEEKSRANPVELPLGTLAPGESKTVPLTLVARAAGKFTTHITATADGGLKSATERTVTVQTAQLSIRMTGPKVRYVEQSATWEITVANPGDAPVSNVVLRDSLPPEVAFQSASALGQAVNGQVIWNVGTLEGREQKVVQVTARCVKMVPRIVNTAFVTADPGLQEQAEAALEIRGVPAYNLDVAKVGDPVPVGGKVTYKITVTNSGSLPGNQVEIRALVPAEMKVVATDGPTQAQVQGNVVTFPASDGLQPKQTWKYTIDVQAQKAGDVRFRVELRGSGLGGVPVIKEESTNIYPPANGNGAPPAPSVP